MSGVVRPKGRFGEIASSFVLIWGDGVGWRLLALAQTTAQPVITPAAKPAPAGSPAGRSPGAGPAADTDASRYVIGPDDSLQITVWQEPSVSGTFPVRPDGMISLVLVGDIQAAGLTPMHLAHDITLKLKKFIQDPVVAVVVAAVKSQRVYLVGEVQHAGPIELTAGNDPTAGDCAGRRSYPLRQRKAYLYSARTPGQADQDSLQLQTRAQGR